MTIIYIDVLIGLNIYVTYILLLATETFLKTEQNNLRRGFSSLAGGLLSLTIFLPELDFILSLLLKLISALIIVFINFNRKLIFKKVLVFFAVNSLFAGVMTAVWQIFTPPKLVIKNGVFYYHFQAITLIVSTIIAYGISKILNLIFRRETINESLFNAKVSLNGKNTIIKIFLDTGNKAFSIGGLPAVFCDAKKLYGVVPDETLESIKNRDFPKSSMRFKTQIVPFETIEKNGVLIGIKPDSFTLIGNNKDVSCVIVPLFKKLNTEADAIAGEALFKTEVLI